MQVRRRTLNYAINAKCALPRGCVRDAQDWAAPAQLVNPVHAVHDERIGHRRHRVLQPAPPVFFNGTDRLF